MAYFQLKIFAHFIAEAQLTDVTVTDVLETGATKDQRRRRVPAQGGTAEISDPLETSESHLGQVYPAQERSQPIRDFPAPRLSSGAITAPLAGARPGLDASGVVNPRGSDGDFVPITLHPSKLNTELDIGSMVEVDIPGYNEMQYGVVRWMGLLKEGNTTYAGVELVGASSKPS